MKAVSGKEMCRALENRGWQWVRTRGSHRYYKHPSGGRTISVPVHGNKTLKTKTQRAIMKDAGLTEADL
ncbi:MAG: type II toxin-antitoxin system HicA family toxin [Gemmataceae bacterium]